MKGVRPTSIDVRTLKLTTEQGFVFSRLVGSMSVQEIVALTGIEEARVVEIVRALAAQGAVEIEDEPTATTIEIEGAPASLPRPFTFSAIDEIELDSTPGDEIDDDDAPTAEVVVNKKPTKSPPPAVNVTTSGLTDVGSVRTNNEDAFAIVDLASGDVVEKGTRTFMSGPSGLLLVVSDGVGGENAGEVASALVVASLQETLKGDATVKDATEAIHAAIVHANELVISAANEPGRTGMGATVVAALFQGARVHFAEVGDSRAYVLRKGELTQVSKDQTHIQILIDQGLLTAEAAKASVAKSVVLQAIGTTPDVIVAQRHLALRRGDVVLLCSDGLTGHVTDAEIATILGEKKELDEACAELVRLAKERGGRDNITVVIARALGLSLAAPGDTVESTLTTTRAFSVAQ